MRNRQSIVTTFLGLAVAGAVTAAETTRVATVSPGELHRFARLAGGCPTYSWEPVDGASALDLLVYRVEGDSLAGAPAVRVRLSPRATSWSPAEEQCLREPGQYAWLVRARGSKGSDGEPVKNSSARFFELPAVPNEADLRAALDTLHRYVAAGGSLSVDALGPLAASQAEARAPRSTAKEPLRIEATHEMLGPVPIVALSGEVPDTEGTTFGVRGTSHSPDGAGVAAENTDEKGADLLLAGEIPAKVREGGLDRDSESEVSFDFRNNLGGSMVLTVDGNTVWHAGNDGGSSGLDANFLGGFQSSDFFRSSGGTLVGNLDMGGYDILAVDDLTVDGTLDVPGDSNLGDSSVDAVNVVGLLRLAPRSAAPLCSSVVNWGEIYFDSEDDTFCFCESGGWRPLDGAGNCS